MSSQAHLVDDIINGVAASPAKLAAPAPTVPRLHPNLSEIYRTKVQTLQEALSANPSGQAALEAAHALIDRIEIKSAASGSGLEIELIGELAAMHHRPVATRARVS